MLVDGHLKNVIFNEDGSLLVSAMTPDGYFVDAEGKLIQ